MNLNQNHPKFTLNSALKVCVKKIFNKIRDSHSQKNPANSGAFFGHLPAKSMASPMAGRIVAKMYAVSLIIFSLHSLISKTDVYLLPDFLDKLENYSGT
jgi:hypothetical protein